MCGRCGVHVGAQMEEAERYYAIPNLRMPREHHLPGPSSPGHRLLPREARSDLHGSVEIVSGEYGIRINTISRCVFGIGSRP